MARKLDLYWSASGLLDEARHWLELGLATGAGTPQERALALAVAARFAVLQNDRIRARELVDEGNEVAAAVDDTRALGLLLVPAAMLSVWDGTPAAAADQADTAVALLRAASNLPGELMALFVAGVCHGFAGNSAEAAARHQQCIARADEVGERHMKALAVAGLGEQELAAGQLEEATALFREAIVLKRELGDRMGMAVGAGLPGTRRDRGGPGRAGSAAAGCRRGHLGRRRHVGDRQPLRRSRRPGPTASSRHASSWASSGSVSCSAEAPSSASTRRSGSPWRRRPTRIHLPRPSSRPR